MTAAQCIDATPALEEQITELAAHISAATWRLLTLIREYDLHSGWSGAGIKSCAHWLNWKCGMALGAAREKVRVAHALTTLPKIDAAFREGRVSYSKVRAMTRVATPENEDYLLMIARHGTATHVERLVQSYRRVGRQEAKRQLAERYLSYHVDDDGCYVIRGRLTPEQGERLVLALDTASDALPRDDNETPGQRRADALERVCESAIGSRAGGGTAEGGAAATGGDRYMLHLHTRVSDLKETVDARSGACDGDETSRRIACDSSVVLWLEDDHGHALDIGRRSRTITPALRRALIHRDGGCRFPGCTTSHRYTDAHHVVHWADGGETRLDNLVLLCRHHHRLVHEGGYGVTIAPTGAPQFTTVHVTAPDGEVIEPAPDTRSRGNVRNIVREHQRNDLRIGPRTLPPQWHGERMDLGLAIDGLLRRDSVRSLDRPGSDG